MTLEVLAPFSYSVDDEGLYAYVVKRSLFALVLVLVPIDDIVGGLLTVSKCSKRGHLKSYIKILVMKVSILQKVSRKFSLHE